MAELHENSRQWDAFQATGHCVVVAPPGSGKTKLLTTKIAYQVLSGEVRAPRSIVCITMTNEAANEIQARLRRLGTGIGGNFFVGTVHSFAISRIVKPFGPLVPNLEIGTQRLATSLEEEECLTKVLEGIPSGDHRDIAASIKVVRNRSDFSGKSSLGGHVVAQLAQAYERALESLGVYDFTGAIRTAAALLEQNASIRELLGAATAELYVDEYQDLAPDLDRIVRALTLRENSQTRLFAVGDPDQSIYEFTGARPSLLTQLAAEPRVSQVLLEQNYRSGRRVIASAVGVLGVPRNVRPYAHGGYVRLHPSVEDISAQTDSVVTLIQEALADGVAHEEIAVIACWRQDLDKVAASARGKQIPIYTKQEVAWRTTPLTLAIELACSWVSRRDSQTMPPGAVLGSFERAQRAQERRLRHRRNKEILELLYASVPDSAANSFVEKIYTTLIETGFHGRADEIFELIKLRAATCPGGTHQDATIRDLGLRVRAPGYVMNTTIHGAKGLEFDRVIIAGIDAGPLTGFNPTSSQLAEGRRKLYVAITRARHRVDVVHCRSRISSRGNVYPVSLPSFVQGLGDD